MADRLIELFIDMLAAERGAAQNTQYAYRRDLQNLATFLADKKNRFGGSDGR